MSDHAPSNYETRIADSYDTWFRGQPTQATVDRLAELAGDGPLLELGVGTGRVAIPLAHRGLPVHGVDASESMVARLRDKPGGDEVAVTIGDFSEVPVSGSFSVIYAATATFFELPSQEQQVSCFANVARHLTPGGFFVLDGLLPDAHVDSSGQGMRTMQDAEQLVMNTRTFDRATQRLQSRYVIVSPAGIEFMQTAFRYAWPGELDLMARMVGLELHERYGSWSGAPFNRASTMHVSVYRSAT
ncbi:class I SAM-dependent methyltransferase [Saccharopolyspora taberi]|uniref:Class I SAM-dependent methyltransferase n=1 Tax=Saccharopolyspora taberi TaxID=60895 RepID=A0ABN3VFU3_9PSEU